jgi:hypothetical protein
MVDIQIGVSQIVQNVTLEFLIEIFPGRMQRKLIVLFKEIHVEHVAYDICQIGVMLLV